MSAIVTIGADIAKNVFPVHGVADTGESVLMRPSFPCGEVPASRIFSCWGCAGAELQLPRQYTSRSGCSSCRMVVAISSMDLVVVDSQRMPARRIMASASPTSMRQFCRLA